MRRALIAFWVALLAAAALAGVTLQILGPLPAPAAASTAATVKEAATIPHEKTPAPPHEAAAPHDVTATHEPVASTEAKLEPQRTSSSPTQPAAATPKVALIIAGIGMTQAADEAAIRNTPPAVDLALSPYAAHAAAVIDLAHSGGHEVLLAIPMEPEGYPLNDEGPDELLTGADPATNDAKLDTVLSRFSGYAGATGALDGMRGERYAAAAEPMQRLQRTLAAHHLFYIDPRPGQPAPANVAGRTADVLIDDPPTRPAIDAALARLGQIARDRGSALGLAGVPRTVTIEAIAAWSAGLPAQGLTLVPAGSLVQQPAASHPVTAAEEPEPGKGKP